VDSPYPRRKKKQTVLTGMPKTKQQYTSTLRQKCGLAPEPTFRRKKSIDSDRRRLSILGKLSGLFEGEKMMRSLKILRGNDEILRFKFSHFALFPIALLSGFLTVQELASAQETASETLGKSVPRNENPSVNEQFDKIAFLKRLRAVFYALPMTNRRDFDNLLGQATWSSKGNYDGYNVLTDQYGTLLQKDMTDSINNWRQKGSTPFWAKSSCQSTGHCSGLQLSALKPAYLTAEEVKQIFPEVREITEPTTSHGIIVYKLVAKLSNPVRVIEFRRDPTNLEEVRMYASPQELRTD
jgi:hypothetical protein